MQYTLDLNGCRPEPFSSYLKSLAVLRLVGEQKDPDISGMWSVDRLTINSSLDESALVDFFLNEYSPTPIVSPWNGGSGFYQGDDKSGLNAILKDSSPRFDLYRKTIEEIQTWQELPREDVNIGEMMRQISGEVEKKKGKAKQKLLELISNLREAIDQPMFKGIDVAGCTIEDVHIKIAGIGDSSNPNGADNSIKELLKLVRKLKTEFNTISRGDNKSYIIRACRNRLDPKAVEWVDVAALIDPDGNARYPPIMGSGGNEGRFEYSKEFMSNLEAMVIDQNGKANSRELLKNALFGNPASGLVRSPIGKFNPGRSGGFNQGFGIEQKDFPINPWEFILLMEGSIFWSSSIGKRQGISSGVSRSPFTVAISPIGYSSSSQNDKNSSEIWAPLWKNPVKISELKAFFKEGRSYLGKRPARTGLEFAESVSSLSVDRGISEFVRYTILKRRGDSFITVPSGRFKVKLRKEADLVRELNPILSRVDSFLREFKPAPPAELAACRSSIDERIFGVLSRGGASEMIKLLSAIGTLEKAIAKRDHTKKPMISGPLSGISSRWLTMANDGSTEFKIAAALASIGPTGKVGSIRANIEPVDPGKPFRWSNGRGQYSYIGNSLSARLVSVLTRRMIDGERFSTGRNPLWGGIKLDTNDIVCFIEGDIDEKLIENLLFGMMWIKWGIADVNREIQTIIYNWKRDPHSEIVPRTWALLKTMFLPLGVRNSGGKTVNLKPEISIIPLLNAGRIDDACQIAQRRLYSSGLDPIRCHFPDVPGGVRIAAALLLPVRNEMGLTRMVLNSKERVN
jgi:CRISPR-associated protein Csx17